MIADLLNALSGEVAGPSSRASISECIIGFATALHTEWIHHPRGPIAYEIDALISALRNKHDPLLKDLDIMQMQTLSMVLSVLQKMRPKEEVSGTNRPVQSAL